MMRLAPIVFFIVLVSSIAAPAMDRPSDEAVEKPSGEPLVFAVFAETFEQRNHAVVLAKSIRAFAGRFKDAPFWIYLPEKLLATDPGFAELMKPLKVEVRTSKAPTAALAWYFSRKVFAAAEAEKAAEGRAHILAWLDEDTVILREPAAFALEKDRALAYRPVMHRNIGSPADAPPDALWTKLYEKLEVPEKALFTMETPADHEKIRPYFNAGLLVVRPERGLLRAWAKAFPKLYEDPFFREKAGADIKVRIFLHQAALAGAALTHLRRSEMIELPEGYNYPLFHHEQFASKERFASIEKARTIRYDVYFRDPKPGWEERMEGPETLVKWIKAHLDPGEKKGT